MKKTKFRAFNADILKGPPGESSWLPVRKKPVIVFARQICVPEGFTVTSREGRVHGKPGDYLMIGVEGERYICDQKIFCKTYEVVK